MIEFKIHLKRHEDLLEEDASLSLGWFEIIVKGFSGHLFRDRYCMVFLSLGTLIEHLATLSEAPGRKERWVGEDHGTFAEMVHKKGILRLTVSEATIEIPFDQFQKTVLEEAKSFIVKCKTTNPSIRDESAFEDLVNLVQ